MGRLGSMQTVNPPPLLGGIDLMNPPRSPRRWLSIAATLTVFSAVLWAVVSQGTSPDAKTDIPAPKPGEWPLFGGTVTRNLVNLIDKNIATDFDLEKNKKVKWS